MTGKDLLGISVILVPLAVSVLLYIGPTSAVVKWLSTAWAAVTFGLAMYIACTSEATIGLCVVSAPFVLSACAAHKHWFQPTWTEPPPGQCRKCGYDLTGNVSGVCPECGDQI